MTPQFPFYYLLLLIIKFNANFPLCSYHDTNCTRVLSSTHIYFSQKLFIIKGITATLDSIGVLSNPFFYITHFEELFLPLNTYWQDLQNVHRSNSLFKFNLTTKQSTFLFILTTFYHY